MLLCVFIIIVLLGILVRPRIKIFEFVPVLFICLALCFSHDAPDFENYERVYNFIAGGSGYNDTGIGWFYLCKAGIFFGLDYRQFTVVIYLVSFILMSSTVRYFVRNYRMRIVVWSAYLLFPALLDAVQLRFLIAHAIVVFGFKALSKRKIRGYLFYVVLCMIASLIHTASIFYLVFLLGPVLRKIQKYLLGFVVLLSIFMIFGQDLIFQLASHFVNGLRLDRYFRFVDAVGPYGLIAYTATLFLFWRIAKYCIMKKESITDSNDSFEICDLFYQMSVLSCFVIPLTFFDTNFFRIQRPMWLMLYVLLVNMMERHEYQFIIGSRVKLGIKIRTLIFLIALMGFVFYICAFNLNVINAFLL